MSSDPTWKRDTKGVEHPTRETLLAFICEQCSAYEENRINEHLQLGCMPCNRLRADLTQSRNALSHLKHMSSYLSYPELQSNQVLLHMRRGESLTSALTGKRKRKFQVQSSPQITGLYVHKKSARIVSLPAAFALLLIFMTAVLVLAYTVVNSGLHIPSFGQQTSSFTTPVPYNTSVAMHQPTPTATVPVTITPTPSASATVETSPTPTVTVTVALGPAIDYCPPHGYVGQLIYICGYGFKAGDKVSLVLDYYGSNAPVIWWNSYKVDKHGEFTGFLFFSSCKNLPLGVYAMDETLRPVSVTSNILSTIPVAGCHAPTPTPTPGGLS